MWQAVAASAVLWRAMPRCCNWIGELSSGMAFQRGDAAF